MKYAAALYTVLAGILLVYDSDKLRLLLLTRTEAKRLVAATREDPARYYEPRRPISRTAWALFACLGLPLIVFALHLLGIAIGGDPGPRAIDAAVGQGYVRDSVTVKSWRGSPSWTGFGRTATVELQVKGTPTRELRASDYRASGFVPWKVTAIGRADSVP